MTHPIQKKHWLFLAAVALSSTALVSCAKNDVPEKIDFEFTGRVLDKETNQPIEGAYVIAIYKEVVVASGGVASHCVKTKGMYSGVDGKFHFPVEKRDGRSPATAEAIKIDYSMWTTDIKPDRIHALQNAEAYTDRNVYLLKQDPLKPRFFGGDVYCVHAKNKEDVAASVEYYKHRRAQRVKYNTGQASLDNIDSMIRTLETLDGRSPDAIIDKGPPQKTLKEEREEQKQREDASKETATRAKN